MTLEIPNLPKGVKYVLSIDTEFDYNKIMEFGAVKMERIHGDTFKVIATEDFLIKSRNELSSRFKRFTGISNKELREKGLSKKALPVTFNRLTYNFTPKNHVIIGHGVKQDLKLLKRSGIKCDYQSIDTYKLSRRLLQRDKGFSLDYLVREFGISDKVIHRAYDDSLNTMKLFSELQKLIVDNK